MAGELRVLSSRQADDLRGLVARDPVVHCVVTATLLDPMAAWASGRLLWGWYEGHQLVSALYAGANLIPVQTTVEARAAFAGMALRGPRRASSLMGPADEVLDLWEHLGQGWGPAREVRPVQPLLVATDPPRVAGHPGLRQVRYDEMDILLPASVAMYTDEVGMSPTAAGGGPAYRARLASLVREGRALAVIEQGQVLFKAEVAAVTPWACQVQGVWVAPQWRGCGLGASGMAGVVEYALRRVAPAVSLYANDYNRAAMATYARVGFARVGTFATVLL